MDTFVASIKKKYKERRLQNEKQWPPVRGDKLIKLQLVEADKTEGFRAGLPQHGDPEDKVKRTPILYGDLFKVEEGKKPVRKLIVEGNAGIGKTTLCTMLTEEWANGEILTQFDCVLLLPLRERSVSTATTLPQLFKLLHSSERIRTSVIEKMEEREGEGVLIIADGWDELDSENRSDNSFLHNLLFGSILPFVSVLLTSRPAASAPLHNLPTVDRLVEVVGFSVENVKQYIKSEFEKCPEKAFSLIEQLENNPLIASACSVPLNCAIVCNVWHTLDRTLPATLTELYSQIVLNIILRNLKKRNVLESFNALSFDSIPENLQDTFWLTCKFAYECLLQDKIVFFEKGIVSLFPQVLDSSDKLLCFGLLQCARSLLPVGQGLSFHFVHLTIQEFLAALHLVTLPNEEKLKVCEAHAESDRFAMVWRFVFGLGCQKEGSYSRKVICLDDEVVNRFLNTKYDEFSQVQLLHCHCSLESLNDSVCNKIGKQINGKFKCGFLSSIAFTPHDCVAVFNVIRHTAHCSNLTISLCECGLTNKLLKELTNILSSANDRLQVNELLLNGNKITDKGITDLFSRASASFSSLQRLDLCSNSITDITPLTSSSTKLTVLSLSDNPLGVSGIQSLETAVQAGVLVNLSRLLLSNTLTDDADINGKLLATLSPSIASHCPCLWELDLSKNNLGMCGASALGGLFSNKSELGINANKTVACSVSYMYSPSLSNNPSTIQRRGNINVDAVAAFTISSKPPCDYRLNLSDNPLGYDGLLAIFGILRSETCRIASLTLANTDLTTQVNTEPHCSNIQLSNTSSVFNLGPVLESSRLTMLSLNHNNFSEDRVLVLAECVRVCISLERLNCWRCSLTSSEFINIFNHLKCSGSRHKNLRKWNLGFNFIKDEGVIALIESVPKLFPSLREVHLLGNPVSGEVKENLEKLMKVNREECELHEKEDRRFAVLIEWQRTYSPPLNEKMHQTFLEMWSELLQELVYGILTHPTTKNAHSLNHWNLVVCEDLSARCDPQKPLELDSNPEDSSASPMCSNDDSVHSATEELDEPVGPPPTATDESTTVQPPHRMDQQETMSSDGRAEVTIPSPHDTHSAIPELTLSVLDRELKTLTKPIQFAIKLGIPQYQIEIIQQDHRHDTEGQKIALFQYIAKNHQSVGITWSSIADALRDIHAGDLSLRIREQYCSHRDD